MSPDTEVPDRLLSAIGEFREEVLLWIDSELVRLREREQAENRRLEQRLAPATGSHFSASNGRLGASPERPSLQSGTGPREPRSLETARDREPAAENARQPLDVPEPETDPKPPGTGSNPRQRLDALARLLDHRLRQAQGEAATRTGAGNGRDTGLEDEPPEPCRREGRG
jgi:hypothetical protein